MDVLYTVVMLSDVDEDEVSVREEGKKRSGRRGNVQAFKSILTRI